MPQREITGKRSLIYSEWHRTNSIKRFVAGGEVIASRMTMIDIDGAYVEAKHPYDRPPVALIETAQVFKKLKPESYHKKNADILFQLGKAANIPVFLVLYMVDYRTLNPAVNKPEIFDIYEFYVKEYYPVKSNKWKIYTPDQYAQFLVYLRQSHLDVKRNGPQLKLPFDNFLMECDDDDLERRWYVYEWEKRQFVK